MTWAGNCATAGLFQGQDVFCSSANTWLSLCPGGWHLGYISLPKVGVNGERNEPLRKISTPQETDRVVCSSNFSFQPLPEAMHFSLLDNAICGGSQIERDGNNLPTESISRSRCRSRMLWISLWASLSITSCGISASFKKNKIEINSGERTSQSTLFPHPNHLSEQRLPGLLWWSS